MEKSGCLYRGRPIEDMSKEELVQAMIVMTRLQQAANDDRLREHQFQRELRAAR